MLNWQDSLRTAFTNLETLYAYLELNPILLPSKSLNYTSFPLRVTKTFAARMEKGNPQDPLLLQVLTQAEEFNMTPDFSTDPLQEKKYNPLPGLLHKYSHRALVTLTSGCAIHCRYCFRRHFPYEENRPGANHWQAILNYFSEHPELDEIILSGGDPLLVKDDLLFDFISHLNKIPHIKRLRIHSRIPVVLTERLTESFFKTLMHAKAALILVIHCNHPNEIDSNVVAALKQLTQRLPITLLNQTVLLKNINDDANILIELSLKLFTAGVLPYYLHVLDKVQGAAHFDLPESTAIQLHQKMMQQLPGYLVPKLVREVAGEAHKIPITYSAI